MNIFIIACSIICFSMTTAWSADLNDTRVNIKGLDKALLLYHLFDKATYGNSNQDEATEQFLGNILHPKDVTYEQCKKLVKKNVEIGVLEGKFLFVNLNKDTFDATEYNKRYGQNAAQEVIDTMRDTNS